MTSLTSTFLLTTEKNRRKQPLFSATILFWFIGIIQRFTNYFYNPWIDNTWVLSRGCHRGSMRRCSRVGHFVTVPGLGDLLPNDSPHLAIFQPKNISDTKMPNTEIWKLQNNVIFMKKKREKSKRIRLRYAPSWLRIPRVDENHIRYISYRIKCSNLF